MRIRPSVPAAALVAIAAAAVACSESVLRTHLADPVFCAAVAGSPQGLRPVDPAASFPASAEKVVLAVSLTDVMDAHTLRARWSDPFGKLYLDTGAVAVNAAGGYVATLDFAATMPVAGAGASLLAGKWKVELLYDERPVWGGTFRIEED